MANTNSRFFSVMAVGENAKKMMDKYSLNLNVEPYIKYKYLDAKKYQTTAIKVLTKLLAEEDKIGINPTVREGLKERLKVLESLTPFEYYRELTEGLYYDEDGNALSSENKEGHWKTCRIGRNFALPLKLKNGTEAYEAKVSDIDWEALHRNNQEVYRSAWEVVMEGREPQTDEERKIYESMKDRTAYFLKFNSKEDYVNYSTSFWYYAYVDEHQGWLDVDNYGGDEMSWVNNFYDRFVTQLNPNDTVTIFECSVNND